MIYFNILEKILNPNISLINEEINDDNKDFCIDAINKFSGYNIEYTKYFEILKYAFNEDGTIINLHHKDFNDFTNFLNPTLRGKGNKNRKDYLSDPSTIIKIRDIREVIMNSTKNSKESKYTSGDDLYFYYNQKTYSISQKNYRELLFNNEDILVCPYCGKSGFLARDSVNKSNETKTDELYSFELDHFFQKKFFPEFALSLFNLIPICKTCNQFIKGQKSMSKGYYFHPFLGTYLYDGESIELLKKEESFNDVYDFALDFDNYDENINNFKDIVDFWSIKEKYKANEEKYNTYLNYLLLNEVYRYSPDTKSDYSIFMKLRLIYLSGRKGKNKDSFIYDKSELFKNWYPEDKHDILKFVNGKMKKDLFDRLK